MHLFSVLSAIEAFFTRSFLQLFNMSAAAAWVILAVVALRILLKKAPKALRLALWIPVGIRLALPFSFESVLSLIPSAQTVHPYIEYADTPAINSGVAALNSVVNPALAASLSPMPEASVNPMQIVVYFATLVWSLGLFAMLLHGLISYMRLKKRVAGATFIYDVVFQSEAISAPFVLGFKKPRVYLPAHMEAGDREHVLAHESAHIARHDHILKPIAFFLLALHWANPLAWLAYALLCRDMELAADERAVKRMDMEGKKAYAHTLLRYSAPQRVVSACPLAFGGGRVKQRIKSVLGFKKPALWAVAAGVLALVILAVCFLTNPAKPELDFDNKYFLSSGSHDMRFDAHPLQQKLDEAQRGELLERLQSLSATRPSDEYAGFTPFYSVSGIFSDGTELSVNGYALDGKKTDIVYNEKRYVVSDAGFQAYISDLCAGKTITQARSPVVQPIENAPIAEGLYAFERSVYMNPLSSYYPWLDSGCLYEVGKNSFKIISSDSGDILKSFENVTWAFEPLTEEEWLSWFMMGDIFAPSTEAGAQKSALHLSSDYRLVKAGTKLWLVQMMNDHVYCVYTLVPQGENLLTPQKLLKLAGYGEELKWAYFRPYAYTDIGSGLYIYAFPVQGGFELTVSGASGFAYGESVPQSAALQLTHHASGETVDFRSGDIGVFIAKKLSEQTKAPLALSGLNLCEMVPVESDAVRGFIARDEAHYKKHNVPFSVYVDGEEVYGGFYTVTDMETGEILEFISPSGLPAQTYLLQNIVAGHGYEVTFQYYNAQGGAAVTYVFDLYV